MIYSIGVAVLVFVVLMRITTGSFRPIHWFVRTGYEVFPDRKGLRWLLHIVYAPIAFQAVRTALELGVFDLLQRSPRMTLEEIARELKMSDPWPLRLVLRACVVVRALKKEGDRYSIGFKVDLERMRDYVRQAHEIMYRQLFYTKEAVEQRKPVGLYEVYQIKEGDFYQAKRDIAALHEAWNPVMTRHSRAHRENLLKKLDYSKYKHIMDVGCNDAELIIELLKRNPSLKATVVDLPDSPGLESSRRNIVKNGLEQRMNAVGLDAFQSPLPQGVDLIQFVHFVNMFKPEKNIGLFRKAFDALVPGGTIQVVGPVVKEQHDGFLIGEPVLYSLVFLVCRTGEGEIFEIKEIKRWMQQAGFTQVETQQITHLEVAIRAKRP